jgi:hypothetical protein
MLSIELDPSHHSPPMRFGFTVMWHVSGMRSIRVNAGLIAMVFLQAPILELRAIRCRMTKTDRDITR